MIRLLKNIFWLLLLAGTIFAFRVPLQEEILPLIQIKASRFFGGACYPPIAYNLGEFDTRFGISEKYFLEALAEAEAIWEVPYGKNLFEYKPDDASKYALKVNLLYDYRQETTSRLKAVGASVADTRAEYDALKVQFATLKNVYDKDKASLAVMVSAFNKRNEAYKTQVSYWNAQGGAPKQEYAELQAERNALEVEAKKIKTAQDHLNSLVAEINPLVGDLNALASELNITVDKYNTIGASRGESFEEGLYRTDGVNQEIDIYEFSNRDKLVRVLAHELGHALGIDHIEDKEAIMYELNAGKASVATAADLAALRAICDPAK